jgi:hypothetical protein
MFGRLPPRQARRGATRVTRIGATRRRPRGCTGAISRGSTLTVQHRALIICRPANLRCPACPLVRNIHLPRVEPIAGPGVSRTRARAPLPAASWDWLTMPPQVRHSTIFAPFRSSAAAITASSRSPRAPRDQPELARALRLCCQRPGSDRCNDAGPRPTPERHATKAGTTMPSAAMAHLWPRRWVDARPGTRPIAASDIDHPSDGAAIHNSKAAGSSRATPRPRATTLWRRSVANALHNSCSAPRRSPHARSVGEGTEPRIHQYESGAVHFFLHDADGE